MFMLGAGCHDAEPPWSRVRGQLAPLDLVRIFVIDLAHPAFIRRYVTAGSGVFPRAIDVDNRLIGYASRMPEHRRSWKMCGLTPSVFFSVVDLDVVDRTTFGSSADDIDIAVMR